MCIIFPTHLRYPPLLPTLSEKITVQVLDALMKQCKAGKVNGLHGRLGDLGTIADEYDCAVTTACGVLNNIVVSGRAPTLTLMCGRATTPTLMCGRATTLTLTLTPDPRTTACMR